MIPTAPDILSANEVIARIDSLVHGLGSDKDRAMIATDADGTLWSGDVAVDTFWGMVSSGYVTDAARQALADKLEKLGLGSPKTIQQSAAMLFDGYERQVISEELACLMMMWVHAGLSQTQARQYCEQILENEKLRQRIHPEMKQIVTWAQQRQIPVYVVSASPRFVVQLGIKHFGIDPENVLAATLVQQKNKLQTWLDEPMSYAQGKVYSIQKHAPDKIVVAAFGDELFDLQMLQYANLAVAVRPKDRLRHVLHQVPSIVELESQPIEAVFA